jgi:hypothetical protein
MEAKDRIEIINQFLTRNDDNDDKVFLFLDYPYPEYIEDLDFKGFSEETQCSINTQQCSVYFEEHSIIIMEINNFYPFTDEKEEKIRDRIEEIARFQEQNSDKDFIILDYDSETGETQEIELPDIADISELIKLIESSTGWKLSEQYSPIDQLADLIEFFNESVEDGTLEGRGSGWLAELRLWLMREMLVITSELIEYDQINAACFILKRAYMRCDSNPDPLQDFVVGNVITELAEMIQALRTGLGCE